MKAFDYDKINRYIDGDMTPEEARAFEMEMSADPELQQEVKIYQEVNETLRIKLYPDEGELALRSTLSELESSYFTSGGKVVSLKQKNYKKWLALAASLVLILAVLSIWSPWKKDLYRQYAYHKMPGVEVRGAPVDSLLKKAAGEFNDKNFGASLPYFKSILEQEPENSFARFYMGIALLESGQPGTARQEFTRLYNGNSVFKYEAAYYYALSYLKEKDKEKAREWLLKIPGDAPNYNKVLELLEKLG
jgi:tetratricopeptide (TPR) repeat protein